jgi:hypothetical protein
VKIKGENVRNIDLLFSGKVKPDKEGTPSHALIRGTYHIHGSGSPSCAAHINMGARRDT